MRSARGGVVAFVAVALVLVARLGDYDVEPAAQVGAYTQN